MEYIILFFILFIVELVYFSMARHFNIIDKPNERSSHTKITLRGGGIIFYFAVLVFYISSDFAYPYFFIGLSTITLVSFFDDIFSLSNKIRFFVQIFSVLLMFLQWNLFAISWVWVLPALIGTVGVINAYNFMDGINGITAWYSMVVLGLLFVVNHEVYFVTMDLISYAFIGILVFSFFNFRNKAKAFAGDVGSVSIAFIIVFLLGNLIIKTENFAYILFLVVYGIDTFWTIILRAKNRENIFAPHRSHLYQYLGNEVRLNKLFVAFLYGALQLVIGFLVILFSEKSTLFQSVFSVVLVSVLSLFYLYLKQKIIKKHVK